MQIAVISDTHFGFGWDTEREDDPFENCREAFEKAKDADLILMPGDIFDKKIPKQEVLARAIELFRTFESETPGLTVSDSGGKQVSFRGKPIVAIHGTHERRSADYVNSIQLLEKMGFLVHLHNENIVFEKDGEKVAIHGMSGVPERYAPQVLQRYDPQPVEDAFNILLLHQSIENFVYTDADRDVLKMEYLPHGFDYIVNGHIHWKNLELKDNDKPLILPGSIVTTQMNRIEEDEPKGFLTIDTVEDEIQFHELRSPRKVFHRELDVDGMTGSDIRDEVATLVEELTSGTRKKPLIRIVLQGSGIPVSPKELEDEHDKQAIINISKKTFGRERETQEIEHTQKSAMEMGMDVLKSKTGFPRVEELFNLLSDGKIAEAVDALEATDIDEIKEALDSDDTGVEQGDGTEEDGETGEEETGKKRDLTAFTG